MTDAWRVLLRLEGLCVLAASVFGYAHFGGSWGMFALVFLAPDLSVIGYAAGPRVGAAMYNAVHIYASPLACLIAGLLLPAPAILRIGLIWCAHIGLDRALGFGLKSSAGFRVTHLGSIGKSQWS